MKLRMGRVELLTGLQRVQGVVEKRNTMPISRSVATISTPSCFASIKIFERIGIVLRFSTTPWTRWRPVKSSTRPIRSFMISSP